MASRAKKARLPQFVSGRSKFVATANIALPFEPNPRPQHQITCAENIPFAEASTLKGAIQDEIRWFRPDRTDDEGGHNRRSTGAVDIGWTRTVSSVRGI